MTNPNALTLDQLMFFAAQPEGLNVDLLGDDSMENLMRLVHARKVTINGHSRDLPESNDPVFGYEPARTVMFRIARVLHAA